MVGDMGNSYTGRTPWKTESPMEQRPRFVALANSGHFTISELCQVLWISRTLRFSAAAIRAGRTPFRTAFRIIRCSWIGASRLIRAF